jgi:hypothetical protein
MIVLHPIAAWATGLSPSSSLDGKEYIGSKHEKSEKKRALKAAKQTNKLRKKGVFDFHEPYASGTADRHSENGTSSQH